MSRRYCLSISIIIILDSLKKTSRILIVDEDVPGGAAGYIFNKVMEEQGGYKWLDAGAADDHGAGAPAGVFD